MDEPLGPAAASPAQRVNGALAVAMAAVHGAFVVLLVGGAVVDPPPPRVAAARSGDRGDGDDRRRRRRLPDDRARGPLPRLRRVAAPRDGVHLALPDRAVAPGGHHSIDCPAIIAAWILPNVTAYGVLARRWRLGRRGRAHTDRT